MNKLTHPKMVHLLVKSPIAILDQMTSEKCDLMHAAFGVAGEAGEVLDAIKKNVVYGQPLDVQNVIEELGDLEFYMEQLRHRIGVTRKETLEANMRKLSKRYEGFQYSDKQAKERKDKR